MRSVPGLLCSELLDMVVVTDADGVWDEQPQPSGCVVRVLKQPSQLKLEKLAALPVHEPIVDRVDKLINALKSKGIEVSI